MICTCGQHDGRTSQAENLELLSPHFLVSYQSGTPKNLAKLYLMIALKRMPAESYHNILQVVKDVWAHNNMLTTREPNSHEQSATSNGSWKDSNRNWGDIVTSRFAKFKIWFLLDVSLGSRIFINYKSHMTYLALFSIYSTWPRNNILLKHLFFYASYFCFLFHQCTAAYGFTFFFHLWSAFYMIS